MPILVPLLTLKMLCGHGTNDTLNLEVSPRRNSSYLNVDGRKWVALMRQLGETFRNDKAGCDYFPWKQQFFDFNRIIQGEFAIFAVKIVLFTDNLQCFRFF